MAIDPKKYTRAELAKMVEDAEEVRRSQRNEYHELAEQLKSEKKIRIALRSDLVAKNQLIHALEAKNASLTEQIDQMNGEAINKANEIDRMNSEAINKANEIARLKAEMKDYSMQLKNANDTSEAVSKELQRINSENDDLRSKLADTEAALGRANALCEQFQSNLTLESETCYNATQRAAYAESHPWRNLWAWVKRKLGGERNEHVS